MSLSRAAFRRRSQSFGFRIDIHQWRASQRTPGPQGPHFPHHCQLLPVSALYLEQLILLPFSLTAAPGAEGPCQRQTLQWSGPPPHEPHSQGRGFGVWIILSERVEIDRVKWMMTENIPITGWLWRVNGAHPALSYGSWGPRDSHQSTAENDKQLLRDYYKAKHTVNTTQSLPRTSYALFREDSRGSSVLLCCYFGLMPSKVAF